MSGRPERRTRWVAAALAFSVLASACNLLPGQQQPPPGGGPGGAGKPGGKPEVAAISVGTAAVIRDLLAPTLSYSGNVQARTQVNLVPKISARLEKLNADVGDEVRTGQVIAELDHAQLDAQVASAEAAVVSATAKLEQTQASAKQEDVDAAQAAVDQAIARLEQAQAGGRPEEIAAARAQAAQAEARAQQVASGAREEDRANLQAAIDQAESQQDQLRAQLLAAQTGLSESKYRLEQARAGRGGPGVRPEDITQAQATLETNKVKLTQLRNPRVEDVRTAELEVNKARATLEGAIDARENCGNSEVTTRTESEERVNGVRSKREGKTTTRASCSDAQKDDLESDINVARADLQLKENALVKIKNPSQYDLQQAEQAVALAEANLQKLRYGGTSDVATLEVTVSRSQAEVDRLQAAVDQSTASITAAQSRLDAAVNPDAREVRQALAAAEQARANLARVANADPFVVAQQVAAVDQAQAQLGSRLRPFTEQDIRVAASAVDQAAAALLVSKVQASEAIIVAPFDATVSTKLISPGAMASPNTPILTLVSKDVEIVVQVEEARVGQVQRGQAASIQVSAFPGRLIQGIVQSVSPSADPRSRTFPVRVVPSTQDGSLRDGMFAQVAITGVGQQSLMVPNAAIVTRAGRNQVFVVVNDRVQARELKLGETDGTYTAVLEGRLQPGDQVVVTNPDTLTENAAVLVEQPNLDPKTLPTVRSTQPSGPGGTTPGQQGAPGGAAPGGTAPGGVAPGGAAPGGAPGVQTGGAGGQDGQAGGQSGGQPGGQSGPQGKP